MANEIEILFGGYGPLPPKLPEFKKPEGRPKWVEVLEEAFIKLTSTDEGKQLYGDPQKGATLEQAWRTSGIFTGKWPVCLISTEKPAVPTSEIKHVIKMSSKQFVDTLTELFEMYTTRMAVQVLYHDDYMGHSVALLRYDNETSRFTYHDPWPGDSLLCRDFNAAGIDAQKNESGWSVTAAELEKVI